jgi:hypothetical protein
MTYNKQILSPAKNAGCDANRVRGRRAKFGRYLQRTPYECTRSRWNQDREKAQC